MKLTKLIKKSKDGRRRLQTIVSITRKLVQVNWGAERESRWFYISSGQEGGATSQNAGVVSNQR